MATRAEQIAALKTALTTFFTTANALIKAKPQSAKLSDNATALDGTTRAGILSPTATALATHAANVNNPHGITAVMAGAVTKAQVETTMATKLLSGALPVSRYGSLDNFPAGVDGSFEAASTNKACRWKPMVLEADDTLVFLRAATNGSSKGVFYSYLRNATTKILANNSVVRSSKRYIVSFMPSGTYTAAVGNSDQNTLCGQFLNISDNSHNSYFVALTNGTMDSSSHQGVLVSNLTSILNTETFLFGAFVYLVTDLKRSNGLEFQIARIPVTSIQAGGTVSAEILTSWTNTVALGTVSTDTNVLPAKVISTTDSSDKTALIVRDSLVTSWATTSGASEGFITKCAGDTTSGKFRIRILGDCIFYATNGTFSRTPVLISVLVDPSAKTAVVENVSTDRGAVTVPSGTPVCAGPVFLLSGAVQPISIVDNRHTTIVTSTGKVLTVSDTGQTSDTADGIGRGTITSFTSAFDFLNSAVGRITGATTMTTAAQYGSAIGGQLYAPVMLSDKVFLMNALGLNLAGATVQGLVKVEVTDSSYTYQSVNNGTLSGWAPTTKRNFLSDLGYDASKYYALISTVKTDGSYVVTGLRFTPSRLTCQGFLGADLVFTSATYSISATILDNLKTAILAKTALGAAGHLASTIELVVPGVANMPAFAIVTGIKASDGNEVAHLAIVGVTITSNVITAATAGTVLDSKLTSGNYNRTGVDQFSSDYLQRVAAVAIYEVTDGFLVAGIGMNRWAGGATAWRMLAYRFYVDKASQAIDITTLAMGSTSPYSPYTAWTCNSIDGFCEVVNNVSQTDFLTKSVIAPIGKTLAAYKTYSVPGNSGRKVMVSQEVAQGFTLYFTEETPVVLNGVQYTMPIGSLDLTTVDSAPASKVFYLYLMLVNGSPAYKAYTSQQPESYTCLYLGKITCGTSKISTIAVSKVTRLGNYRVSTTPVGGAIPAVAGHPATATTLPTAWKSA